MAWVVARATDDEEDAEVFQELKLCINALHGIS